MPETHLRIQRTAGYGGLAALLCGLVLIWHDGRQPVAAAADSFHSAAGAISQSPSPVLLAGGALLFFGVVTLCLAAGIFLMRRILAVRPLRVVPWILAALALALFLAGAGLKIWDTLQPVPLGWFAYEPLTRTAVLAGHLPGGRCRSAADGTGAGSIRNGQRRLDGEARRPAPALEQRVAVRFDQLRRVVAHIADSVVDLMHGPF